MLSVVSYFCPSGNWVYYLHNAQLLILPLSLLKCAVNKTLMSVLYFLCHTMPPADLNQRPPLTNKRWTISSCETEAISGCVLHVLKSTDVH